MALPADAGKPVDADLANPRRTAIIEA